MTAVQWIFANVKTANKLHGRALVTGYEHTGLPLWTIKANYNGCMLPGKLAVNDCAWVPYCGGEHKVSEFEVLCVDPDKVEWVICSNGNVPANAIAGGNNAAGEILYIGRVKHRGSLTPGKVHPSHRCLYISWGGSEHKYSDCMILCLK